MGTLGRALAVALLVAAVGAGAFWAGRQTTPPAAAPPPAPTRPGDVAPARIDEIAALRAELRALRDEVRAREDRAAVAPQAAEREKEKEKELTADQADALARGQELVTAIIQSGKLTRDRHRAFDALVAQLPDREKRELLSRLFMAINERRVEMELP